MKIYNYDKSTKEFISESIARENPLEKGKYLVPANATDVPVIQSKEGYARVFNENKKAWEYVEDHRGTVVYSTATKEKSEVSYLGEIKEGFTTVEPPEFAVWDVKSSSWVIDVAAKQKAQEQAISSAIEKMLDEKAQEYRYDNMTSARSYAGYKNPFQQEAQSLAVWAANCWLKAGEIEADVKAGNREMPTVEEVLSEMPLFS